MPFIIECHVFHTETTSLEVGDNVIQEDKELIPADQWTLFMVVAAIDVTANISANPIW